MNKETSRPNYPLRRTVVAGAALLSMLSAYELANTVEGSTNAVPNGTAIMGRASFKYPAVFRSAPEFSLTPTGEIDNSNVAYTVGANQELVITNPIVVKSPNGDTWLGGSFNNPNKTIYADISAMGVQQMNSGNLIYDLQDEGRADFKLQNEHYIVPGGSNTAVGEVIVEQLPVANK